MANHRLGVAIVDDPLERDVAQPARRLAGDLDQLGPVLVDILVGLAIGLRQASGGDEKVVEGAPVNLSATCNQPIELLSDPTPIAMPCLGVESIRIDLGG